MTRPTIAQADGQIGFHWRTQEGSPITLPDLVGLDEDPPRLPPTHLSALDDALIDVAERFGALLGGSRSVTTVDEVGDLTELHRTIDRLCHEYAAALPLAGLAVDVRGGQIVGTAQLMAIRARMALGMAGPTPFAGELADPSTGVVAGYGRLQHVDPERPWCGARWVVVTEGGPNYPLTLSMLLFDSSGVNKDSALDEHREALRGVTAVATGPDADPFTVAGAIEWLLYDWLMAHRENASAAITMPANRTGDAEMIVAAADALVLARARLDPGLFDLSAARR